MDGLTFASCVLGKDWDWYLEEYGLVAAPDNNWLIKTITQTYEALEPADQTILHETFPKACDGIIPEGAPKVLRLKEWLFDAMLEPYLGQRLSVYTAKQIFYELVAIRKEQLSAWQKDIVVPAGAGFLNAEDESIINVAGEGQLINYEDDKIVTDHIGAQQLSDQYEEENWKLGHKYKEKLNLAENEVSWLNKFWNPFNSFLSIEGCCIATIRLYLHCMKKMSSMLEKKGTTVSGIVKQLQDQFTQSPAIDAYAFTYEKHNLEAQVYLTIFRRSENFVREYYQHKRKVTHIFPYAALAEHFEQHIGALIIEILNSSINSIDAPDNEMELQLNEMNVNRWKFYFNGIVNILSKENADVCATRIDHLGTVNEKNPSLENIYYEASKAFAKTDKLTGIRFYLKYIYADLHSEKIDGKQLGKTIQKALFSNEEQLHAFEEIANKLIETKDLSVALAEAASVYEKKRKKINLDTAAIAEVRSRNLETIGKLNEILQEEEIQEIPVVENPDTQEIVIQLALDPGIDAASQEIVFVSGLNFNDHQAGLLSLFGENNYMLSVDEVNKFARSRNIFKNQLIESINDCCYEQLDDNLIEETEDRYEMNDFYYQKIINLC